MIIRSHSLRSSCDDRWALSHHCEVKMSRVPTWPQSHTNGSTASLWKLCCHSRICLWQRLIYNSKTRSRSLSRHRMQSHLFVRPWNLTKQIFIFLFGFMVSWLPEWFRPRELPSFHCRISYLILVYSLLTILKRGMSTQRIANCAKIVYNMNSCCRSQHEFMLKFVITISTVSSCKHFNQSF